MQPNKEKKTLTRLLFILAVPLLGGVVGLVMLYNQTVNVQHAVDGLRADLQEIQTNNAELKERFFGLFDRASIEQFVQERNLIKERNPEYLTVKEQWAVASQ